MNTVQLECFLTVAEYLNFSKASEALKLTQPAVTHQIQSLEKELNVKLFRRTSKNVSLTQEGYLFLADAQLILKTAISARDGWATTNISCRWSWAATIRRSCGSSRRYCMTCMKNTLCSAPISG